MADVTHDRHPAAATARERTLTTRAQVPWHTVRVVAVDDRMQAWLDGQLCLEHRDTRL